MILAILIEELKSRNFLRCHRSYLVNISHIDSILQNKIILKNSVEIPVGRVYKKELKTFLMNRIGDM
ncbi:LytTR family DNA-binding domain-containing protein [Clostridium perfringens]|uniref:LytTR family DNA-binding domain-containing protein n=1 Tax=Clostridium perfringens TaxID=1502 RepID=UPI0024BC1ACE|nr:LytTR family DNA-binding domain-containing protein [Clostridium perfringens]